MQRAACVRGSNTALWRSLWRAGGCIYALLDGHYTAFHSDFSGGGGRGESQLERCQRCIGGMLFCRSQGVELDIERELPTKQTEAREEAAEASGQTSSTVPACAMLVARRQS
uniref:Uncharacterized protein n=1 Tax=Knipowitschia caucasica TaxID=637954 RepID=A0AAV2MDD1_KNICA